MSLPESFPYLIKDLLHFGDREIDLSNCSYQELIAVFGPPQEAPAYMRKVNGLAHVAYSFTSEHGKCLAFFAPEKFGDQLLELRLLLEPSATPVLLEDLMEKCGHKPKVIRLGSQEGYDEFLGVFSLNLGAEFVMAQGESEQLQMIVRKLLFCNDAYIKSCKCPQCSLIIKAADLVNQEILARHGRPCATA